MNKMKKLTVLTDQPETHLRGMLTIESSQKSKLDCDFGIQIAEDDRIWICIDGEAFIRFKPKRGYKEQL